MANAELKEKIHEYINRADDRLLKIIYAILNQDENEIVAYTTSGKPLTRADYRAELKESEEEIKCGEVISHEDLEKEIEKW